MSAQQTPNPYDRRVPSDYAAGELTSRLGAVRGRDPVANSTGVSMGDIDGLVRRKESRAFEAGVRSTTADHMEALRTARRQAWDQGHAAGFSDGQAVARQSALQVADRAPKLLTSTAELLSKAEATDTGMDYKSLTRDELYRALDSVYDMLGELVSELEGTATPLMRVDGPGFAVSLATATDPRSTSYAGARLVPAEPSRV